VALLLARAHEAKDEDWYEPLLETMCALLAFANQATERNVPASPAQPRRRGSDADRLGSGEDEDESNPSAERRPAHERPADWLAECEPMLGSADLLTRLFGSLCSSARNDYAAAVVLSSSASAPPSRPNSARPASRGPDSERRAMATSGGVVVAARTAAVLAWATRALLLLAMLFPAFHDAFLTPHSLQLFGVALALQQDVSQVLPASDSPEDSAELSAQQAFLAPMLEHVLQLLLLVLRRAGGSYLAGKQHAQLRARIADLAQGRTPGGRVAALASDIQAAL